MWRSFLGCIGRLFAVLGVCLLVALAPSTSWAADPTPTDTASPTATPTDTASPTSTVAATPTDTASPTSTASAGVPTGTESDPLIVQLPSMWLAVLLLVGALNVFLLAAILVSGWGS